MNLLLDTHVFIWMDSDAERLSDTASALLQDEDNHLYLSLASVWEMQIKHQLGKLTFEKPLAEIIQDQIAQNGIQLLPITLPHILGLSDLPHHHRDPFDRLIISQALLEDYTLISHDEQFEKYEVNLIW